MFLDFLEIVIFSSLRSILLYVKYLNFSFRLNLLTDGRLRHLIHHEHNIESIKDDSITNTYSLHAPILIPEVKEPSSYIHDQNKYCMDKVSVIAYSQSDFERVLIILANPPSPPHPNLG